MHVFTYGSLMYRSVWERVVSRSYQSRPARVCGFIRLRVSNEVYPALLRGPADSSVHGMLYLDVSPVDLAALDRFEDEGEMYGRIQVSVELDDGGVVDAAAYLFLHPHRVDGSLWDPARFKAEGLQHFLNTYVRERTPWGASCSKFR